MSVFDSFRLFLSVGLCVDVFNFFHDSSRLCVSRERRQKDKEQNIEGMRCFDFNVNYLQ